MSKWVRLCAESEVPQAGAVGAFEARGVTVCLANVEGTLHALDNWCPHRRGPLGEGWLEGSTVVCPWHCWAFEVNSGKALPPETGKVAVFDVKMEDGEVLVNIE